MYQVEVSTIVIFLAFFAYALRLFIHCYSRYLQHNERVNFVNDSISGPPDPPSLL